MIFADTSAFFAIVDLDDGAHERALQTWAHATAQKRRFITTNYVAVEAASVIQARLGFAAVQGFAETILPLVKLHFVEESLHNAGLALHLTEGRRKLSLVDCVSATFMRMARIQTAFAYERHFQEFGFETL